jgi:exosortase/archaeosortase family protein
MNRLKATVLAGVAIGYVLWLIANAPNIRATENGTVQAVLGSLFAVILLLRTKPARQAEPRRPWVLATTAAIGFPLFWIGLRFNVHQFEWVGLLLIFYAGLAWAMRPDSEWDVRLALLVLYGAHPIPGQVEAAIQFAMQWLSVLGAECVLQAVNVRVWADGLVLRAGPAAYGVPEACSGLKTALTVSMCLLGTGLLFRFSWVTIGAFLALGLAQVLALNILRIAGTVWWAPRMTVEWGQQFLHDTLGVLLLACVVLTIFEAWWWKVRCDRRALLAGGISAGAVERPDRGTIMPRFWVLTGRWWLRGLAMGLLVLAAGVFLYRQRPAHRAAMVTGVVDNIIDANPEAAARALDVAMRLTPGERDLQSRKLHILVVLGRFEEALRYADGLKPPLVPFETVLKSRSLMALGRAEEAMALLDSMPAELVDSPPVAILRAEYAAIKNEPEKSARMVVLASRSLREIHRVRGLFPFLAAHEQWRAIAASDMALPYRRIQEAVISVQAGLRVNDLSMASRSMRQALAQWPNDLLLLAGLSELAAKHPGGDWEDLFAGSLGANLGRLKTDEVARYLDLSAEIGRPDLIWMTYIRLSALDANDPAIFLAPAQYGGMWFTFRRHRVGIYSSTSDARMDLRSLCRVTRNVEPFRSFWDRVPLIGELSAEQTAPFREESLRRALAELDARERNGKLTRRMRLSHPLALALAGRFPEAHRKLDQIEKDEPVLRSHVALLHAILYDQEEKWQDAYESVVRFDAFGGYPSLTAEMIRVNTLVRMNLGVAALESVRRARQLFPNTAQIALAEAGIWSFFGAPDQALAELGGVGDERGMELAVILLRETGRYVVANRIARGIGMAEDPVRDQARQPLVLEPAERAAGRRFQARLTRDETAQEIVRFERGIKSAASPFLRAVGELELEWLRTNGAPSAGAPARWRAAGRNALESMAALYRLTILLAREGRFDEAGEAVREALTIAPESPILHRLNVAIEQQSPAATAAAMLACPRDPEIWLAWLVGRFNREGAGPWVTGAIAGAAKIGMPPSAIVRAGDFLLRKRDLPDAGLAAREAMARAEGLIAGYALGLKCALARKDAKAALDCAQQGIEHAADPAPFYKVVVIVKSVTAATDAYMVAALEYLQGRYPKDSVWSEGLGTIYFERSDTRRSMRVFGQLVGENMRQMRVRSLLLAAESSRVEGEAGRSVEILQAARELYPGEVSVLNNLVYTLGAGEGGAARAAEFLQRLLNVGGDRFEVQDTAAMVYLKLGRDVEAQKHMEEALKRCDERMYGAPEVHLNAAEIYLHVAKFDKAREQVGIVLRKTDRTAFLDRRASDLLRRIKEAENKKK